MVNNRTTMAPCLDKQVGVRFADSTTDVPAPNSYNPKPKSSSTNRRDTAAFCFSKQ